MLSFQTQLCPEFLDSHPTLCKAYERSQSKILNLPILLPTRKQRETDQLVTRHFWPCAFVFHRHCFCFLQHSLTMPRYFLDSSETSTQGGFLEIFLCSTSPCHTPHHKPHIELDSSRCIYCPLLSWWHNLKLLALSIFDSVPMAVSAKGMVLRQPLQCYTYQWRLCRASEAWRISLFQNDLLCPAGHQQWHRRTQCSGPWLPLPCSEYFQSVLGMNTLLGTLTKYQEDAVHFLFFWRGFHSRRNTRLVGITVMRP